MRARTPNPPRDPNRLSEIMSRGRQAVVALAFVASTLFAGPASPAVALTSPSSVGTLVGAGESTGSVDEERGLGARLAVEYAGAVPAPDVESLVRAVGSRLRRDESPADLLPHTTEAVSRRALTDHLARGAPLPVS